MPLTNVSRRAFFTEAYVRAEAHPLTGQHSVVANVKQLGPFLSTRAGRRFGGLITLAGFEPAYG